MNYAKIMFCDAHVQKMRDACEERGMGHLCGRTPREALEMHESGRFEAVIRGMHAIADDILHGIMAAGGDPAFLSRECPLCQGERECDCGRATCAYKMAIPCCADALVIVATGKGLLGPVAQA
jgi:hypothetical protein